MQVIEEWDICNDRHNFLSKLVLVLTDRIQLQELVIIYKIPALNAQQVFSPMIGFYVL